MIRCTIDPQINQEARINHAKSKLTKLVIELEWLKKHMTQLGFRSQPWRRRDAEAGGSSGP